MPRVGLDVAFSIDDGCQRDRDNYFSAIGQHQQFTATATLSNGTKQDVTAAATWTLAAGATGISVSSTGLVTAQGFRSGNVVATYRRLFTNYPTCSVLHGQQYPNPTDKLVFGGVSTYGTGDFAPPSTSGNGLGSFISGATSNKMCLAIFDTRLLNGTTMPNTWTPPMTTVNYIITFGFSGSGTASPQ